MSVASPVEFTDEELLRMAASGPSFGDSRLPPRFWAKVEVSAQTGCWIWMASRQPDGYGKYNPDGYHPGLAHRIAYGVLVAPLPQFRPGGQQLDHLCRQRPCVNPLHLELVTGRINIARASGTSAASVRSRAVTGKCHRGHADWEPHPSTTGMHCRTCEADRQRARNASTYAAQALAAKALGLTWSQYIAEYGRRKATALAVVSGK